MYSLSYRQAIFALCWFPLVTQLTSCRSLQTKNGKKNAFSVCFTLGSEKYNYSSYMYLYPMLSNAWYASENSSLQMIYIILVLKLSLICWSYVKNFILTIFEKLNLWTFCYIILSSGCFWPLIDARLIVLFEWRETAIVNHC